MCATRLTEPRLQTAISSSEVLSVISVHRFELCTTPTCCCGLRMLQGSLNVIHGCPVSNSIDSILRHSWTRRDLLEQLELAARRLVLVAQVGLLERLAELVVQVAARRRARTASTRAFSITRFMNRSGIQLAVFMSWVRRRSSPVFLRSSRNSSMSRCQVSR